MVERPAWDHTATRGPPPPWHPQGGSETASPLGHQPVNVTPSPLHAYQLSEQSVSQARADALPVAVLPGALGRSRHLPGQGLEREYQGVALDLDQAFVAKELE